MRHGEINFRTNSDTGLPDDAASIVPIDDGEPVIQTTLRRPPENLRTRSDVLRETARENLLLADFDRNGAALFGGGTITFNGARATYDGIFTLEAGTTLYLAPFATPGDDGAIAPYVGSTLASLEVDDGVVTETLVFTSKYKQWQTTGADPDIGKEANSISVEIQDTGSLSVVVNGATGEKNSIVIGIDYGTTTCQQVIDEVNNDADAKLLVVASLGTGTITEPSPKFGPAEWGTDYTVRFLAGGAPGLSHKITAANLASFMGAHAENPVKKGDTIAISYDKLIELSTDAGRFQSTAENANTEIPAGALFNTRREPAKIPGCLPICKCIDDDTLIFVNGAHIVRGTPATLTWDSAELAETAAYFASQTPGADGAIRVGAEAESSSPLVLSAGTVRSQLNGLLTLVNTIELPPRCGVERDEPTEEQVLMRGDGIYWTPLMIGGVNEDTDSMVQTVGAGVVVTADNSTNTFTSVAHGFVDGDRVYFYTSGSLPAEMYEYMVYYVINATADTFQIEVLVEGSGVFPFTDDGSGTLYVREARTRLTVNTSGVYLVSVDVNINLVASTGDTTHARGLGMRYKGLAAGVVSNVVTMLYAQPQSMSFATVRTFIATDWIEGIITSSNGTGTADTEIPKMVLSMERISAAY